MGRYHLSSLKALPDIELVACCDIDEGRLNQQADAFGVPKRYRSHQEMLEKEKLDIVAVATQARQHCECVLAAAESGVAGILCEKPMALDLKELDDSVTTMYLELLKAIEAGREHPSNGEAGRAALEMIMAVYESHRRRGQVNLPLPEREHPLLRWRREAGIGVT